MIVAIPACSKDVALVEDNLTWLIELKQERTFGAMLCLEGNIHASTLVPLALQSFKNVDAFSCDVYQGDAKWPRPQNYAWQTAARRLALQNEHWFWWEADVAPLRANWLALLDAEYRRAGKPFMGHITQMGWMNGVAVYPADIAAHTRDALLCREAPWDATLWRDIKDKTHAANHLIGHFPRYTRVRLSVQSPAVAAKLVAKGYACFHGCNDGSLVAALRQGVASKTTPLPKRPKPTVVSGDTVIRHLSEADVDNGHDESEAIWQQDAQWLLKEKYVAPLPFEECRQPAPSFARQNDFPAGFFPLPHGANEVHYNPGLVRQGKQLWLLTRRWLRQGPQQPWRSSLVAWSLDEELFPSASQVLRFARDTGFENYEDPRVVFHGEQFVIACGIWRVNRLYRAHQAITTFDARWQFRSQLNIPYGGNGMYVGAGSGHEKNWTPFFHDGALHIVYLFQPHTILRVESPTRLKKFEAPMASVPWAYGDIHGGTPPVRLGDEYVTFFHSSLAWRGRQKRYYVGAYAFDAKPPFKVTRLTHEPIVRGSDQDPRILGGPLVTFACGALLEKDDWLVTLGVNDECAGFLRIPVKELDKRLHQCT